MNVEPAVFYFGCAIGLFLAILMSMSGLTVGHAFVLGFVLFVGVIVYLALMLGFKNKEGGRG